MPYIVVMGSLSAQHLSKDDGATVYGLKSDERSTLVAELNKSFSMSIASSSESERTVRVTQRGLTLVVVNRLHALLGYDVISHSMAMTNANRELISFTLYKKSSHSHGHPHSPGHGHSHGHSQSHGQNHSQSHSNSPRPGRSNNSPRPGRSNVVTL